MALVEDGDAVVVDLNSAEINCTPLLDIAEFAARQAAWQKIVDDNGGVHPSCGVADTRLLRRTRFTAVPATFGAGSHPDRQVWVRDPRAPDVTSFVPSNKWRQ